MEKVKHRKKERMSKGKEGRSEDKMTGDYLKEFFMKIRDELFTGNDPSSLGVLRLLFGLLMMIDIPQERGMSMLTRKWSDPDLCGFPLFSWLHPLPLEWMYMVYSVMFLGAFGIMLGFMYRISCLCFVTTYWYIFLLDKTSWNNHSYLYGLTGIMLLLTNAHHYWSIDGLIWPSIRNVVVPKWHYSLFKFQFFIVYFYAGLKKLDMDWVAGYSMVGLSRKWVFDPLKLIGLPDNIIDHFVVHICGLTFDMIEGFLLLFDRTRPLGFFFGASFHLMNSQMFSIGMFPWTMLATMPIFCYPDWPKKWFRRLPLFCRVVAPAIDESKPSVVCSNAKKGKVSWKQLFVVGVAAFYAVVQIILPYSHSITQGYNAWTQGLYGYSWDMMVHSWSTQHILIKVVDNSTGKITYLKPGAFTHSSRNRRWSSHPDMMKQYAVCLSERLKNIKDLNIKQPRIYFDVWRSLNKRMQQRLVDPNVDMVTADWSPVRHSEWLRPLLTGLTPWRERLRQIEADTYEKNNISDVTFVADFPGLALENYIDNDVNANITVLHGKIAVEFGAKNWSLGMNETMELPRNETHIVHVVSATPACYMYESYNVTWEDTGSSYSSLEEETSKWMKENEQWKNKTTAEKFGHFLDKKYRLFKFSFDNALISFRLIVSRGLSSYQSK